MKEYKNYNLEDFLLDEDFRNWVLKTGLVQQVPWEQISRLYPEKKTIITQAKDLILTWRKQNASLTEQEIEVQIARILHSTESEIRDSELPRSFNWKWLSVAASVILIISIGLRYFHQLKTTPEPYSYKRHVAQADGDLKEIINKTNRKLNVYLPDSSAVELTPGSKISYSPSLAKDKTREIILCGEAFFNVTRNTKKPFFVYANGLMTRVLGTSFLVKSCKDNVEVIVRSGQVSVVSMLSIDSQNDHNTELLLTPNQQAIFTPRDNVVSKSIISTPVALAKVEIQPDFNFENQPVSSVFTTMEKAYGIHFIYDTTVMKNCHLRVRLNDESFFTKLDIICQTIGASYRVSDGQVIITSAGCE